MTATASILLTPGEPAGIGPDLCILLAQQGLAANLICVADPQILVRRAEELDLATKIIEVDLEAVEPRVGKGELAVMPVRAAASVSPGKPTTANATYLLECLSLAANHCKSGRYPAMVTGPLNKATINDAGIQFSGHTEYLAEQVGGTPVMLLATDKLRVALATTHLPLRRVSDAITKQSLQQTLEILHHDLQRLFRIPQPRILVCGLNPHAGESGHLGTEEIEIIIPVLETLRARGLLLMGPLPADTLFTPKYLQNADAVLAMYHDQGLPVLKYSGFGEAVNITLGLPIIRTSVDHGTAFDLAGTGKADPSSLIAAIDAARQLTGLSR